MKGFKNVEVYVENEGVVKRDVAFDNGVIVAIGNGLDIDEVLAAPFTVVTPDSSNPYRQMYVPN